jgi:hypothetical protein
MLALCRVWRDAASVCDHAQSFIVTNIFRCYQDCRDVVHASWHRQTPSICRHVRAILL